MQIETKVLIRNAFKSIRRRDFRRASRLLEAARLIETDSQEHEKISRCSMIALSQVNPQGAYNTLYGDTSREATAIKRAIERSGALDVFHIAIKTRKTRIRMGVLFKRPDFREKLDVILVRLKITHRALAKGIGVAESTLSAKLHGNFSFKNETLENTYEYLRKAGASEEEIENLMRIANNS